MIFWLIPFKAYFGVTLGILCWGAFGEFIRFLGLGTVKLLPVCSLIFEEVYRTPLYHTNGFYWIMGLSFILDLIVIVTVTSLIWPIFLNIFKRIYFWIYDYIMVLFGVSDGFISNLLNIQGRKITKDKKINRLVIDINQESYRSGSNYATISPAMQLPYLAGIYASDTFGNLNFVGSCFRMGEYVFTAKHNLEAAKEFVGVYVARGAKHVKVEPNDWVEVHPDVVATSYVPLSRLELKAAKSAQLDPYQQACIYAFMETDNWSTGPLKQDPKSPATLIYEGSTRPGFSGSPYVLSAGSNYVLGIHLSGGGMNMGVNAHYLNLITSKRLVPYSSDVYEPEVLEAFSEDSGEKALKMALKMGKKKDVKFDRQDQDEVFFWLNGRYYGVERPAFYRLTEDSKDVSYESALYPKNLREAPLQSGPTPSSKDSKQEPKQNPISLPPTINDLTDSITLQKDYVGQTAQTKPSSNLSDRMVVLEKQVEEILSLLRNSSTASQQQDSQKNESTLRPQQSSRTLTKSLKEPSDVSTSVRQQGSGNSITIQQLERRLVSMELRLIDLSLVTRRSYATLSRKGSSVSLPASPKVLSRASSVQSLI